MATTQPASDLSFGEIAALTPLVILMLVMGVAPSLWFNTIQSAPHPPGSTMYRLAVDQVVHPYKVTLSSRIPALNSPPPLPEMEVKR